MKRVQAGWVTVAPFRKDDGCKRTHHMIRAWGLLIEMFAEQVSRLERQSPVVFPYIRPSIRIEGGHRVQRGRNTQPGGRVTRSSPIEFEAKARAHAQGHVGAVADVQWSHFALFVLSHVEERGSLWSA